MPSTPSNPRPSFQVNGTPLDGQLRPATPQDRREAPHLNDGKDQIFFRAQGQDYVLEGESLDFSGLKQGSLPQLSLHLDGAEHPAQIQSLDDEAQGWEQLSHALRQAPPAWGRPSQIAGSMLELADLQGNRDGLWSNENDPSGTHSGVLGRNPLALKAHSALLSHNDLAGQIEELQRFRFSREADWGAPVTQLDISQLKDGELFAVQKAIALTRMERQPQEVSEGFIQAAGQVDGQNIAARDLFWQRFAPVGEPSGKMVVMFPGFLQSGRNFYEQIEELNQEGHDVLVMDQQWAGQSRGGRDGGVDRGYGVARDVAAMTAYAQTQLDADYGTHPGKELILMGTSLGGGPGVMGALTLNANDKLELDGPAMPRKVKVILQGPFFEATDTLNNAVFDFASGIPLANQIPLPSTGLPVLTQDEVTAQKLAQGAVLEDFQARLQAMTAVHDDMQEIMKLIENGQGPDVPIQIIHAEGDPLASAAKSAWLAERLPQAQIQLLDSENHVLEQHAQEQQHALSALRSLIQE